SDWQLTDNPRDRYRTDWVVNELPRLVDKYQPDQLLVLGDITESKDSHPATLVNEVVEIFYQLSKQCEVVILQGNHDFLHKDSPFFQFLIRFDNIRWIANPTVTDNCLYLPHTRNYKKDWEALDFAGHDFIFAHNLFQGTKVNGQKLSGIPTNIFPDDSMCISGDVHEPQTVDVVTYVGSPFTTDFGDDFQSRVLLLDHLSVKSIKVYGPQKRIIEAFVE
ncbi:MAG: metallophosphoesterase, partial [Patescibacteria group bacterium]|nr:metallophosphoesterase [Patescibacteria group bacterium]